MFSFDIDFDEASRAWRANKKKTRQGCFAYICGAIRTNGKPCTKINCRTVQHKKQLQQNVL